MEAGPQSQSSTSLIQTPLLQDGRYPVCKEPSEQEQQYVQTTLEGCLPFHPNNLFSLKVIQVCMKGDSLPVQGPLMRTGSAPGAFTKLVLAHLTSKGVRLIAYLDELLIIGKHKWKRHIRMERSSLMESLGFMMNFEKSQDIGTHKTKFWSFIID